MGFHGMYWVELTQQAALGYAEMLAKSNQIETLNAFLRLHPAQQRQHRNLADHTAPDRDWAAAGSRTFLAG